MTNVPVMVDQKIEETSYSARSGRFLSRHQNARGPMAAAISMPTRRFLENPTPISELRPNAFHLRHRQRPDLLPWSHDENQAHGWSVWSAMMLLFLGGAALLCWWAEARGNPIHQQLGVAMADGNMEGKEVQAGISQFRLVRDDYHRCLVRRGQRHARFFHRAGRFRSAVQYPTRWNYYSGGAGAGLYGMLVFVVLAVFIAGLMVGRTSISRQKDSIL